MTKDETCKTPCDQCPWRLSNQGKRSPGGFYTKTNLRRLWHQIRTADQGIAQSCHLTDPQHPDHVAAGAPLNAKPQECPGSVIVVMRELQLVTELGSVEAYLEARGRRGLTAEGLMFWMIGRYQFGGVPIVGCGPKLPAVADDPEIGLPAEYAP